LAAPAPRIIASSSFQAEQNRHTVQLLQTVQISNTLPPLQEQQQCRFSAWAVAPQHQGHFSPANYQQKYDQRQVQVLIKITFVFTLAEQHCSSES
jgi:hypothetical protein